MDTMSGLGACLKEAPKGELGQLARSSIVLQLEEGTGLIRCKYQGVNGNNCTNSVKIGMAPLNSLSFSYFHFWVNTRRTLFPHLQADLMPHQTNLVCVTTKNKS